MADLVLLSDDEQLKQKFQSAVTPFVSENEISILDSNPPVLDKDFQLADRLCPFEGYSKPNHPVDTTEKKINAASSVIVTPQQQSLIASPAVPEPSATSVPSKADSNPRVGSPLLANAQLVPLPSIPTSSLRREFLVTPGLEGVDVTSLDITPHGCYVLAGCGNGMVLLFDLTQPTHLPALVGQIVAKGLHTSLLLTVKISEDCRFCFAGVTKGSSELLAIDLGRLPGWPNQNTASTVRRREDFVLQLVHCYRNSDPKLRGFGDAVRVRPTSTSSDSSAVYRLACGRGIKNVHVWQFVSPPPGAPRDAFPTWHCIYDVASNGNTIESVVFRNGGQELLSKSAGVCLRVWDLRIFETDPTSRPTFVDIQNSADVRSLHDGFAFGGTYEFAVVRLAAPKAANRDVLEVPERALALKATGRRMIRQVDDVIATADARHALILCTDGGVIYFNRTDTDLGDCLFELPTVQRDPDSNIQIGGRGWALRRVGREGEVLALRTLQTNPIRVVVAPLSDESKEVKPTSLPPPESWTEWGCYFDPTIPIQKVDDYLLVPTDRPSGSLPLVTPGQKSSIASTKTIHGAHKSSSGRPPLVPGTGTEKGSVKRQRKVIPNVISTHRITPATNAAAIGSVASKHAPTPIQMQELNRIPSSRAKYQEEVEQMDDEDCYEEEEHHPEEAPVKRRPLVLTQPPKVRRVVQVPMKPLDVASSDSMNVASTVSRPSLTTIVYERFKSLCSNWIEGAKRGQGRTDAVLSKERRTLQALGVNTLRQLGLACFDQDRLRTQFVAEIARSVAKHLQIVLNNEGNKENIRSWDTNTGLIGAREEVDFIIKRYQSAATEMVRRQQLEISGLFAMDSLMAMNNSNNCELTIIFRHGEMWNSSREFLRTTELVYATASSQQRTEV